LKLLAEERRRHKQRHIDHERREREYQAKLAALKLDDDNKNTSNNDNDEMDVALIAQQLFDEKSKLDTDTATTTSNSAASSDAKKSLSNNNDSKKQRDLFKLDNESGCCDIDVDENWHVSLKVCW
jgi:hypothetical protein